MARTGLTRLLGLGGAVACVLVAIGLLPTLAPPTELVPRPAVIVNDTSTAVVLAHCSGACPLRGGETVEPGHELRAGLPRGSWVVRTATGEATIGCLTPTAAGQRLAVSQAVPCRT